MRKDKMRHGGGRRAACRVPPAVVALLVALICVAYHRIAYAEVDWHEKSSEMSATVSPWPYPSGREYALAEFLGYDWESLSNDVRTKIKTDSNGDNAFAMLLEHNVVNVQYETIDGALNWPIISLWSTLFGLDKCWDISCSRERYDAARDVMKKYIFPSEGTSEEDGNLPADMSFTIKSFVGEIYSDTWVSNMTKLYDITGSFTVNVNADVISMINNNELKYGYAFMNGAYRKHDSSWWASDGAGVVLSKSPITMETGTYNNSTGRGDYVVFKSESAIWVGRNRTNVLDPNLGIVSGSTTITGLSSSGKTFSTWYNEDWSYIHWYGVSEEEIIEPYEPVPKDPIQRPQDPGKGDNTTTTETTEINILPDLTLDLELGDFEYHAPFSDVSVQIETLDKDIDVPDPFDPTVDVGGNATDVTGWLSDILTAINKFRSENSANLSSINTELAQDLDALDSNNRNWLKNIYKAIVNVDQGISDVASNISTAAGQIRSNLEDISNNLPSWMRDALHNEIDWGLDNLLRNINSLDDDICNEIYKDAKWIVDNLTFEYDDSKQVDWLKKIYGKLRGQKSGIPDVTEDPEDWLQKITDMIMGLLQKLVVGLDLTDTLDLLDELKGHFPFSIPWDVLAVITLFAGEPVAPQVDFPIVLGETELARVEVDLSAYEDVAEISRKASLILFGVGLYMNMNGLLATMKEGVGMKGKGE